MKVSIITINKDNLEGLRRTMASVFAQTSTAYEYIVIDGASSDGSAEEVARYADRLAFSVSEPDNGIYSAMNKGLRAATGDYCIFMNSGDCFHSADVLAQVVPQLGEADFCVGHMQEMGGRLRRVPRRITAGYLLYKYLPHQSVFIRTAVLKVVPYDESLRIVADWGQMFETMVLRDATYQRLDLVVSDFDITGISAQAHSADLMRREHYTILRRHLSQCLIEELGGRDHFERHVRHALVKENLLQRDWKILRNVLKVLPRDLWRACFG